MNNNKKWLSLPIAMWIVILLWLLTTTIIEYILPFSKNIKWVENSTRALYQSISWIEETLYFIKKTRDNNINEFIYKPSGVESFNSTWALSFLVKTNSSGNVIPMSGKWESIYNNNWDVLSLTNPIQIPIWKWVITNFIDFEIAIKVPDLDKFNFTNRNEILDWDSGSAYVNWALSSDANTLNSTWSYWSVNDIGRWNLTETYNFNNMSFKLYNKNWKTLDNNIMTFKNFYNNNCEWNNECSLKIYVTNDLVTTTWEYIPFLESQIRFNSNNNVPYYNTIVSSRGRSYWFSRDLDIKIAKDTLIEAFDFTVFQ
jgi:hypothetical protein